tara:strand:- start:867 stop:1757 length:891 start_codon:yes stop_codon:yes gene_type:complete
MRVLIIGANGQLGKCLADTKPEKLDLISYSKEEFDLLDIDKCLQKIDRDKPNYVINAAAYTAVDKAETEQEIVEIINAQNPYKIAYKLHNLGGKFIQISTDFVFSGLKSSPYKTNDDLSPLNEYGKSKALCEKLLLELNNSKTIRTSWLYSPYGKNFCLTMLHLHKSCLEKKVPLRVVSDQISCPTSCFSLSNVCWKMIINNEIFRNKQKIFHWSDAGVASWYDFAVAIGEIGLKLGLLENNAKVLPIKSKNFPTPAKRPCFSLLDSSDTCDLLKLERNHWRFELENVIEQIKLIN